MKIAALEQAQKMPGIDAKPLPESGNLRWAGRPGGPFKPAPKIKTPPGPGEIHGKPPGF